MSHMSVISFHSFPISVFHNLFHCSFFQSSLFMLSLQRPDEPYYFQIQFSSNITFLFWLVFWFNAYLIAIQFSSLQFSRSVVSDSLRPHESQHARLPCPSPTPGVHSDSRPSSQWCHPAISSSVVPFSSWPQSLPASESFPMSQLFAWGGQSTGVSASASSPSKEHPRLISFRMDWLDLLAVQGTLKSLLQHHSSKASILQCSAFFTVQLSHPFMTTRKTIAFDQMDLCWQSNVSAFEYSI